MAWKFFPHYWCFARGSTEHWGIPLTHGQWSGAVMLPLLLAWTSCWKNSPAVSDLGCHDAQAMLMQWRFIYTMLITYHDTQSHIMYQYIQWPAGYVVAWFEGWPVVELGQITRVTSWILIRLLVLGWDVEKHQTCNNIQCLRKLQRTSWRQLECRISSETHINSPTPDKMTAILQMTFSIAFSWMIRI